MLAIKPYEFWFVTGSQHLYGDEAIKEVEEHTKVIVDGLNKNENLQYKIIYKAVLTNSMDIRKLIMEANRDDNCAGIITWMHTFNNSRSEEHTSELQSRGHLVCRLLLEKKN